MRHLSPVKEKFKSVSARIEKRVVIESNSDDSEAEGGANLYSESFDGQSKNVEGKGDKEDWPSTEASITYSPLVRTPYSLLVRPQSPTISGPSSSLPWWTGGFTSRKRVRAQSADDLEESSSSSGDDTYDLACELNSGYSIVDELQMTDPIAGKDLGTGIFSSTS
jgi:hypothetical protein